MARAGRKRSTEAKRRQTSRAGQGRAAVDQGTPELRERKLRATRRADLPIEPLGVLYGHGKIDESEYRAGLRLEQARRAFLGADTAAERQVYGDRLTRGAADQWAARQTAANGSGEVGQDRLRREARVEAEYDRLLATLHACSRSVAAATLGIATRPYAGAWLATALVEGNRNWGGRHQARLALIREGLQAIDRLGSRPL
jgi:hypothetical protein